MCETLKIIDVYEGENLTCRARCVKQLTFAAGAGGAASILLTPGKRR
jgi:hypothetical protein